MLLTYVCSFKRFIGDFQVDFSRHQCIDELNLTFEYEAPTKTTVYRLYGGSSFGCRSLKDEFREGHSKSVVVPEKIDASQKLIMQDCHVILHDIEAPLYIGSTSIHSTLFIKRLSTGARKCSKH